MTGVIRGAGSGVEVDVELVSTGDESLLWSGSYRGGADEIQRIDERLTADLERYLRPSMAGRAVRSRPAATAEAYRTVLRGRHVWNRRTTSDLEKSIRLFEEAIEQDPTYPLAELAYALAVAGRTEDARLILAELRAANGGSPAYLAGALAGVGDRAEAFRQLEAAVERKEPLIRWMQVTPMFDPLRGDPRFERLRERVFSR